jgi:enoyl-[acyl-carrier protein] reductase III
VIAIDLSGRTALVTGGGRGLGRAVSLGLAQAGANVVVGYLRHPEPAQDVVDTIKQQGGAAVAVQGDVSRSEDVERLVAAADQRFGGAEIFVSNAALGVFAEPPDLRRRAVERTLQIGAWPLLDVSRRLFGYFERSGYGRIVAVSSVGSRRAIPRYAALAMAKGATEALTRYLAEYVGRRFENVTANAVVPAGFHDGDLSTHVVDAELAERLAQEAARTPGGRMPTTAEVANAVLFLVSELAAGVNGQELVVDRGWLIS